MAKSRLHGVIHYQTLKHLRGLLPAIDLLAEKRLVEACSAADGLVDRLHHNGPITDESLRLAAGYAHEFRGDAYATAALVEKEPSLWPIALADYTAARTLCPETCEHPNDAALYKSTLARLHLGQVTPTDITTIASNFEGILTQNYKQDARICKLAQLLGTALAAHSPYTIRALGLVTTYGKPASDLERTRILSALAPDDTLRQTLSGTIETQRRLYAAANTFGAIKRAHEEDSSSPIRWDKEAFRKTFQLVVSLPAPTTVRGWKIPTADLHGINQLTRGTEVISFPPLGVLLGHYCRQLQITYNRSLLESVTGWMRQNQRKQRTPAHALPA